MVKLFWVVVVEVDDVELLFEAIMVREGINMLTLMVLDLML